MEKQLRKNVSSAQAWGRSCPPWTSALPHVQGQRQVPSRSCQWGGGKRRRSWGPLSSCRVFTALLRESSHVIQLSLLKCTSHCLGAAAWSICPQSILGHCDHPKKKKKCRPLRSYPRFPRPCVLPGSADLSLTDTACEWNHTPCGPSRRLLSLSAVTSRFVVLGRGSVLHRSVAEKCCHWLNTSHSVCLSIL